MQFRVTQRFKRTTLIIVACTAILVGLFLAQFVQSLSLINFFLLLPLVMLIPKRGNAALLSVILISFAIGLIRGGITYQQLHRYDSLYGANVQLQGIIADDTSLNQTKGQTEFHVNNIYHASTPLPGRIQISTREDVQLNRGDYVSLTGKLQPAKGTSRQGYLSFAKVQVIKQNKNVIEKLRKKFFLAVQNAIPEPYSGLGLGYLFGFRATITPDLRDQLSLTGLTHIIAVSGYNLTIIVEAVRRLFAKRSSYQSIVGTSGLLFGFVIITGSSPSINRAAVVCSFGLLAWYYGRRFKPLVLLMLSGAITGFIQPLYVWGDPGWYLSFLAFTGVLILAPLVSSELLKNGSGILLSTLLETLAAQLCTLPYVLYLFGSVSVISPLANLLVLPFIPIIMLLIFITGLVGIVAPFSSGIIGILPHALLVTQLWIIKQLSNISFAKKEIEIHLTHMILGFFIIVIVMLLLHYRNEKEMAKTLTEVDSLV